MAWTVRLSGVRADADACKVSTFVLIEDPPGCTETECLIARFLLRASKVGRGKLLIFSEDVDDAGYARWGHSYIGKLT